MDRLSVGLVLVAGAWMAMAAVPDGDATDPKHDQSAGEVESLLWADEVPVDPVGEAAEAGDPILTCNAFGNADNDSNGVDRYRGNVYRIEHNGTVLREIKMGLAFFGNVDLHFTVRAAPAGDSPQTFEIPDGFSDIVVPANGTGAQQFFSSGAFSLELLKDFDYAIGVSWGRPSGSSVTYFNDNLSYPLPFTHGQTVRRLLLNSGPPLPDSQDFGISSSTGAYSMQLCFTPVEGACCEFSADPQVLPCSSRLAEECVAEGSFFHGDRTDCRNTVCRFGACCDPCGTCPAAPYTPESCDLIGGTFEFGADCPAGDQTVLCPKTTGACCARDGTCDDSTCESECVDRGDTYLGDGTTCQPNMCAGACCIRGEAGGCTETTGVACLDVGGAFKGNGTTCSNLPPELECGGACCLGFGATLDDCEEVSERARCTEVFPTSAYIGDGLLCPVDDPETEEVDEGCGPTDRYGACCLPDGVCVNTTNTFCSQPWVNGVFSGLGTTCDGVQCTVGSCCLPDGSCQIRTQDGCAGVWTLDGTCVPSLCPPATGACCDTIVGVCSEVSQDECIATGGLYQGDGSTCGDPAATCPGFGACCRTDGECFDLITPAECIARVGSYEGHGTLCEDVAANCDQRGACCTETGMCLFVLESECDGLANGSFEPDADCATATCNSGACCISEPGAEPRCEIRRDDACPDDGVHVYQGDDTLCSPSVCEVAACCLQNGACIEVFGFQCAADGGEFSPGAVCGAGACTSGACCVDGVCSSESLAACTSAGGVYQGAGVPCEADLCDLGSCCERDNTCTPDIVESECFATFGLEFRPGVTCESPLPCEEIGACCLRDGTCLDGVSTTRCETEGGQFTPTTDANACDELVCPVRGACCTGGGCGEVTAAECAAGSGVYQGDLVACSAGLCTVGSCCLLDGETCEDERDRSQCGPERGSFRASITCSQVACNRPGACCLRDGVCVEDVLESICTLNDGAPSPELSCAAAPFCIAEGACCQDDGECLEGTETDCAIAEGTYLGNDTTCDAGACPTGACCVDDQCEDLTAIGCANAGGVYDGDGTACADGGCDVGSCCHLDGSCEDGVLRLVCEDNFDRFEAFETCINFCIGRGACCLDTVCQDALTEFQCTNAGGTFDGVGSVCQADLCSIGGCCLVVQPPFGSGCNSMTRQACESAEGTYLGASSNCDDASLCDLGACCEPDGACTDGAFAADCPEPGTFYSALSCADEQVDCVAVGSCCLDNETCQVITQAECLGAGGRFSPENSTCEPDDFCLIGACCAQGSCDPVTRRDCDRRGGTYLGAGVECGSVECATGACCQTNGTCIDNLLPSECTAQDAEFSVDMACVDVDCDARGACCAGTQCSILTRSDCLLADGIYQGTGSACDAEACAISIIGSDPADCSIDARQPFNPDGSNPAGWDSFQLTFDGDASGLDVGSFSTLLVPENAVPPPAITSVVPVGNTAALQLDSPIPAGHWTCITHMDSGEQVCLAALPADSDADATSTAADLVALLDCLMDGASCDAAICDLDRSGRCAAADVLRAIDLLGGAESYAPGWLGVSIGPCPSGNP